MITCTKELGYIYIYTHNIIYYFFCGVVYPSVFAPESQRRSCTDICCLVIYAAAMVGRARAPPAPRAPQADHG